MGPVRGRDRWNQRGVRRGYDQVKDVEFVVGGKVNMFRKIESGEKRKKLRSEMISGIVEMNVKVTSNDKFMRCGGCKGEKRIERKWTMASNECMMKEDGRC